MGATLGGILGRVDPNLAALRRVRPRPMDVYGDSFGPDGRLWGCGAWILLREAMDADLARRWFGHGWHPEGAWKNLHLHTDDRRVAAEAAWDRMHAAAADGRGDPVGIDGVWDGNPGSRPSGRASALQFKVRMTDGRWAAGNLLRVSLDLVGFDAMAVDPEPREDVGPERAAIMFLRGGALVGFAAPMHLPGREGEGPPWPKWERVA